ncbi:MAG: hypothetical protein JO003_03945 [Candidatus Eremiobacteraeota bacterium]|nr:hypothetical protein [Candidatus Eremiobacteraeota bacterium]
MRFPRIILFAACAALFTVGGTIGFARAAAQQPALLTMLPGSWSCTYRGPKGTRTSTLTITSQNANWLLIAGKDGAYGTTPAHEGATLFGYDNKKDQYVGMGGNTLPGGEWGIGTAKASPSATTMTFLGAYPADPTHDKTTYTFSASTITYNETWSEKGKAMSGHGSCTKQ